MFFVFCILYVTVLSSPTPPCMKKDPSNWRGLTSSIIIFSDRVSSRYLIYSLQYHHSIRNDTSPFPSRSITGSFPVRSRIVE